VERAGNGADGRGSITAFYTVLTEGDDPQDPVADTARAILDGHIVLTRALAEAGHYPAIDVEQSISRVMSAVVSKEHLAAARGVKRMVARYQRARDLISLGAYVPGQDAELDQAVQRFPAITRLLQTELVKALAAPEVRNRLVEKNFEPVGSSAQEFGAVVTADLARYGAMFRELNIQPD